METTLIYRGNGFTVDTQWQAETNADAASLARDFLVGEQELLQLAGGRSLAMRDLMSFFESAGNAALQVSRSASGDLRIGAAGTDETLIVTGRTARVLCSYLDDEPVRTSDRLEMTQRVRLVESPAC